jgi:hypothetical protein
MKRELNKQPSFTQCAPEKSLTTHCSARMESRKVQMASICNYPSFRGADP